ncbi:MAG: hypothetical protein JXX29_07760 [Deltaproteobacteria bacterium]|nr:hypothetical protein [Deltaproteobacteria bacterium]MBN2671553.1 hypothetical protein [Deltaproteobacteria bacterium]
MNFSNLISATLAQAPIPAADPLGYPMPAVLLQLLSYLTLALHFMAVNFTLGGLIYLIWLKVRKGDDGAKSFLGLSLPLGFSYLVTLGIPPLLFVQVMYGQMFYSSSVIIGAAWILVVPLLILAYGMLYLNKLKKDSTTNAQLIVLGVALLTMLSVGFIYVNNLTLSMTPDTWMEKYAATPSGANLNLSEPTLFARYVLFMSPALVVGGAALVLMGIFRSKWRGNNSGDAAGSLGMRGLLLGRVITAAAAGALIAVLPKNLLSDTLVGAGRVHLILGIALALLSTALLVLGAKKKNGLLAVVGTVLLVLEAAMFVVVRDMLRQQYLAPQFTLSDVSVHEQWGMFSIFAVSMVAGLAFLIVLTVKVSKTAIAKYKETHAG